jgi:pimeloyl-ACP methyl ester carboxylesterase
LSRGTRLLPLGLLVALVALGAAGAIYQAIATARDRRAYPPPGRLVDVGGHRLHLHCLGEGSPTVILESALSATVSNWIWVQPEVARVTRVCAYDPAGYGWRDPGPGPRDARQHARELHTLLDRAGVPGPYVLVGHSFGGLYARQFTALYPDEVAGMVLVDATHPDFLARQGQPDVLPGADPRLVAAGPVFARLGVTRLLGFIPPDPDLPPRQQAETRAYYATATFADATRDAARAFAATLAQVRATGTLGDLPLAVVSAGTQPPSWQELQRELATLSTNVTHQVVAGATHASIVDNERDALETTSAVLRVVQAVRAGERSAR